VEVHVSVDVRDGTEIFLAVEATKCSSTVSENNRAAGIFSLDWSPNYVQPKLLENRVELRVNIYWQ